MDKEKCMDFITKGIGRSGKVLKKDGKVYKETEEECIKILGVKEYERLKKLGDPSEDIVQPVSQAHVLSMKWGKRFFVIVKDPQETEIETQCSGHNDKCINFPFELSTGTSNEYNFFGTFLPIKRQDEDGWIHKDGGLDQKFMEDDFISKYLTGKLKKEKHTEECLKNNELFVKEFLNRFGCWRQLQISAALAKDNSVWNSLRVGQLLKEFVMYYNWKEIPTKWRTEQQIQHYISEKEKIIKTFTSENIKSCETRIANKKSSYPGDPLLRLYNALKDLSEVENFRTEFKNLNSFIQSLNGRTYEFTSTGIFYQRLNSMVPIQYDIPVQIKCTDEEQCAAAINRWLGENTALCETSDRTKSAHSKQKPKSETTEKPKHDKTDATYFSGWLREC